MLPKLQYSSNQANAEETDDHGLLLPMRLRTASIGRKPGTKGPAAGMNCWPSLGGAARNFRDPQNPNLVGLIFEVPDVQALATFMKSAEVAKPWPRMA
jgi:hypothetical protein